MSVLIADGDADRGKQIAEACAARGLACELVTHGAAALELALLEAPGVLVSQLALPLIDGLRLAGILDANPRTHGMGLLLLADERGAARGQPLPGELIEPPIDPVRVAGVVQALLAQRRPAEPVAAAGEGGVEGQLAQLPLTDLLELFHVSRKTGSVELVRRDGRRRLAGRVALRSGDVVHARVGEVEGVKAFFRLLAWERGSFAFRPGEVAPGASIEIATTALLREGRRQLAEWRRAGPGLPSLDSRVRLVVERSALPNVIHPLTQEVLLVLELHSRVADVVDQCSFPDYQVLRTLGTLAARGIVELRRDPEPLRPGGDESLFTPAHVARLRDWLGAAPRTGTTRDAKLLVVSSSLEATGRLGALLEGLPDAEIDARVAAGAFSADDLITLGRMAVDEETGIELVHVPADRAFAPFWPTAGYGALGVLCLLTGGVEGGLEKLRPVREAMRALPRSRLFHVLLMEKGERVEPEAIRDNLALLDEGSLFLVPLEHDAKALSVLREALGRILP